MPIADRLKSTWRRITLCRHRSELAALRLARSLGLLAIFPISLTVCFWWFALNLPTIMLGIPALMMMESDQGIQKLIGGAIYLPLSIYAIVVLTVAAPWFFRWYFIAVALMFGRTGMADNKEAELLSALERANAPA